MESWEGNALQNFVNIWIIPEIKRRQQDGLIPTPFEIVMAQIIFFPDGKPAEVRLNDEVKFRVITKDGEEPSIDLTSKESNFQSFTLTEENLRNCGHMTMVGLGDNSWSWSFDLIYNKEKTEKHLQAAEEFIAGAEYAAENKLWRLFSECIFGAKELISRAYLLSVPDKKYARKGSHKITHSRINKQSHLGNVPNDFVDILNKFSALRGESRYVEGDVSFTPEESENYISLAWKFFRFVESRNLAKSVNKALQADV